MSITRLFRFSTRVVSAMRSSAAHQHVVRPVAVSTASHLQHWSACFDTKRSFAAEAGFLDRDDVKARVLEVVKKFEKVQPEKVSDSSHFVNDLGLDSLDTVELVMALEDEFAIEIPDADAEQILTCTDAVEYLANNIHAK